MRVRNDIKRIFTSLFLSFCLFIAPAASAQGTSALTKVRVQLKWMHQFQFAGFYAAIEQGYFEDAGLKVELFDGGPEIDPIRPVILGEAEFGIGNSSLLIDYNNGYPVKAVAGILQHSPFVILARGNNEFNSIKDLEGHTLMGEHHAAELYAYLKLANVDLSSINIIPYNGSFERLWDEGRDGIDAMTAYTSTIPYAVARLNKPYRIFNPREYKIDFYGDVLYTSSGFASERPDLVIAMRQALIKGWQYARDHSNEIIDLILDKYPTKRDKLALTFEAGIILGLLNADRVDIGYMSRVRWESIGKTFVDAGVLRPNYSLDGFIFQAQPESSKWASRFFILFAASVFIIFLIVLYVVRSEYQLKRSRRQLEACSQELEQVKSRLKDLSNSKSFF